MPYIGEPVSERFASVPSVERFSGDGSTTGFTLGRSVSSTSEILVSVDGVVQDITAYSISGGTGLVFSAAPSSNSGNNIFVNYLGLVEASVAPVAENKGNFKAGGLFRTNAQSLESDLTIAASENANATGTLSITSGVTLTIESGGRLVVL